MIKSLIFYLILAIPGLFILYRLFLKYKLYGSSFEIIRQVSTLIVMILFALVYSLVIFGLGKIFGFMLV